MSFGARRPSPSRSSPTTRPGLCASRRSELRLDRGARLGRAAAIEHIGSTAVPGLVAKPVIDVLLGLRDYPLHRSRRRGQLERIGYDYRGEFGIPGRQFFRKGSPDAHHVHAVLHGGGLWRRHVAFRDWLREHGEDAARYGDSSSGWRPSIVTTGLATPRPRRSSSKTCSREPAWAGQGPPLRPVSEWRWSASNDLRWAGQGPPLRAFRGRPAPEHEPCRQRHGSTQPPSPPLGAFGTRPTVLSRQGRRSVLAGADDGLGDDRRCERFHWCLLAVSIRFTVGSKRVRRQRVSPRHARGTPECAL